MSDTEQQIEVIINQDIMYENLGLTHANAKILKKHLRNEITKLLQPTDLVDSKLHDSVGIKTVDGELADELDRIANKHFSHSGKDYPNVDASELTCVACLDDITRILTAHLQATVCEARLDEQNRTSLVEYEDGYTAIRFRRLEGLYVSQDERISELQQLKQTSETKGKDDA